MKTENRTADYQVPKRDLMEEIRHNLAMLPYWKVKIVHTFVKGLRKGD